jgi:hypothetical protein
MFIFNINSIYKYSKTAETLRLFWHDRVSLVNGLKVIRESDSESFFHKNCIHVLSCAYYKVFCELSFENGCY